MQRVIFGYFFPRLAPGPWKFFLSINLETLESRLQVRIGLKQGSSEVVSGIQGACKCKVI